MKNSNIQRCSWPWGRANENDPDRSCNCGMRGWCTCLKSSSKFERWADRSEAFCQWLQVFWQLPPQRDCVNNLLIWSVLKSVDFFYKLPICNLQTCGWSGSKTKGEWPCQTRSSMVSTSYMNVPLQIMWRLTVSSLIDSFCRSIHARQFNAYIQSCPCLSKRFFWPVCAYPDDVDTPFRPCSISSAIWRADAMISIFIQYAVAMCCVIQLFNILMRCAMHFISWRCWCDQPKKWKE